jgi:Tfp pilus assembly protein PilO
MEFETLMKLVIGFATLVAIPVGAYAAITATRAIWVKGEPKPADPELKAQVETLEARVVQLEADHERMLELEERVDFAERVLAKRPDSVGQLPDGR